MVIGGGVAKAGPVLFDPVQRWVKRFAQLPFVADLTVEPAQLDNAGLIGAARLGWDALGLPSLGSAGQSDSRTRSRPQSGNDPRLEQPTTVDAPG